MQIPKLVVFDVDGTLVNMFGQCHERTRAALETLRASQVTVAIATGRAMAGAPGTLDEVGGADWMACGNGAVVFETSTGKRIRDRFVAAHTVELVVNTLRSRVPGVRFAFELDDTLVEEPGFSGRVPDTIDSLVVNDILHGFDPLATSVRRLIAFHDEYDDRLAELAAHLDGLVDDVCQIHHGGFGIVDISPKGDNKAVALQVLADHLGIDASDVIAFGDGWNDVEMLQWAGTGVAMSNASAHVQAEADAVTGHVDNGGIADYLEPLLQKLSSQQ